MATPASQTTSALMSFSVSQPPDSASGRLVNSSTPTLDTLQAALAANESSQHTWSMLSDQVPQTKLIASLVLFCITLLSGYLPVRMLLNQNYIQHAMFAGGGVLMATAFCHLIPEAHDSYKLSSAGSAGPHQHQRQHLASRVEHERAAATGELLADELLADEQAAASQDGLMAQIGTLDVPYLEVTLCCGFFFMYLVEQFMVRFINNHTHEHPCDTSAGQLVVCSAPADAQSNGLGSSGAPFDTSVGNLSTSAIASSSSPGASELYKFVRGLLIVSAFGAHSIFDGVAIGSQESVEKVWTIFAAISCHKLIIAAVVGLELYAATLESHTWTLVHLTIFSIMSPIGIILVVVAQNSLHIDSNHPAMILLQSFATGTLLYIIFVEILQPKEEDRAHDKNKLAKSFSLIAGFALMLAVLTLIDH